MSSVEIILSIIIFCFLIEFLAYTAQIFLYDKYKIFFLTKDKPKLSKTTIKFISALVKLDGAGSIKIFDKDLGWKLMPDGYTSDAIHFINSRGIRSEKEYDEYPPPGKTRILASGDCLTFGEKIFLPDTWIKQIEKIEPSFEVINLGVEGYGQDQIYLKYLKDSAIYRDHKFVLIEFVATNVFKSLNSFRPFLAFDRGLQMGKPRFSLEKNKLKLWDNPAGSVGEYKKLLQNDSAFLKITGKNDYYLQTQYKSGPLDFSPVIKLAKISLREIRKHFEVFNFRGELKSESEALQVTLAILEQHINSVIEKGSIPVVIFMPLKSDMRNYFRYNSDIFSPVKSFLNRKKSSYIDLVEVFSNHFNKKAQKKIYTGRHYSIESNRLIAESITLFLKNRFHQSN